MAQYPERRTSRAAGWSRRTAVFSAMLCAVALIGHRFGLVATLPFLWVLGLVALLAAFALIFSAFAFSRLWKYGDRGGRDLTAGALVALLVLAPFGVAAYWATVLPPLRDISTDLDDPPALTPVAPRGADANVIAPPTPGERALQAQGYPLAAGRSYDLPFDSVLAATEAVLQRRGWMLSGPLPPADDVQAEVTIDALAKSFILGLPADVAIRVRTDGDSTLVDMRSASRYGRHDLGDNADRITGFLAELDRQVAGQVGPAAAASD